MPLDLQALKTEVSTDPLGNGYSAMDDSQIADSLNAPGRVVDRDSVTGGEIAASSVRTELAALSNAEQTYVRGLWAAGTMPLTANLRSELGGIFPAGSQTRANLVALLRRTGSRAEELGIGRVTASDVANAKRLP